MMHQVFGFFFAGLPHEILQLEFYVPGSTWRKDDPKFRGKAVYQEILETTAETAMCYVNRATKDRFA